MSEPVASVFAPLLAAIAAALLVVWLRRAIHACLADRPRWREPPPPAFRWLGMLIGPVAARIAPTLREAARARGERRLAAAGLGQILGPEHLWALRLVLLGACAAVACVAVFTGMLAPVSGAMGVLAAGVVPDLWLAGRIRERGAEFGRDLPFLLELLLMGLQAGLALPSALQHATDHMTKGAVRDEFARMLRECRAGMPRGEALARLDRRVDRPAVANLVAVLRQSEASGGRIADLVAEQAQQGRTDRILRAERLAHQAPVRMLLPLVALLFPVTFLVLLVPIVLRARESGALDLFLN